MNESLFTGLNVCLGIQFLILGFVYIIKRRHLEIGITCFILGTSSIYDIDSLNLFHNFWANIFLADYRSMIIPSLFYIYLSKKIDFKRKRKNAFKHVILPSAVVLLYVTIKFGFTNTVYLKYSGEIILIFWFSALVITIIYAVLGYKIILQYKKVLIETIYKRYMLISSLIFFYVLSTIISLISQFFVNIDFTDANVIFSDRFNFVFALYKFLGDLAVLIVGVIELDGVKKFFLNKNIYNQFDSIKNETSIQDFLNLEVIEPKEFKNKDFDIKQKIKESNIGEKEFRLYLKKKYQMTINDYINHLRLEEFIINCKTSRTEKYDLEGLAYLAGFPSKSTFYRVFKKEMKITPSEFLKNTT